MLLPVQRVKEKNNALGVDMKRLEIPFYNFLSASHLKTILYASKRTAKYFGNKSDFFSFGGNVRNVWETKNTI